MLRDHSYPGLDRFRLVAAFLVVAIHISPLSSFDATADFIFTRIIARVGVPFFLMTSGFFLLPAYFKGQAKSFQPLKRFWCKTGLLTLVDHHHAAALAAQAYRLKVHIKVDTGMSRLGESFQHPDYIRQMFGYANLEVTGIYTHLCAADSSHPQDMAFTQRQIESFYQVLDQLTAWGIPLPKTHIQSSYGLVNYPEPCCDYVRPGIALYGVRSSFQDLWRQQLDLKPVLALKARVSEVKDLEPGQTVGYGRCFTATKPMRIAALAIGYGDGIPRNLKGGRVLLKGSPAPILGRICMDILMVDISNIQEVTPGEIATLIGSDCWQTIPAEELADQAATITNQLFCSFGNRLPRVYLDS